MYVSHGSQLLTLCELLHSAADKISIAISLSFGQLILELLLSLQM